METKFNFKSQICTTREQSERLLSLGLKKETADMGLTLIGENEWIPFMKGDYIYEDDILAWSLHRLLSMLPRYVRKEYIDFGRKYIEALDLIIYEDLCIGYKKGVDESCHDKIFYAKDIYSSLCDCIEWLIKEGYFNKEYLENETTEN